MVAIATVALLSGCVPQEPVITPEPEPSSTPVFASDEEALAAATDAYAKYLEVYNAVAQDGGNSPDRLGSVVTSEWLQRESDSFEKFAQSGQRQVGDATFDNAQFQMRSSDEAGHEEVKIYVCWDLTGISFVDTSGHAVQSANNPRVPLELLLESGPTKPLPLLVAEIAPWSGTGVCSSCRK